ncbi:18030_t:CDS:2 [Cetraspora pellucida]|uniref:18030_t:CDS:1 n=1 Tax=Cetraspora pellucida TaxID=1433469 RepID=A0ACA9LVW8_9GLOM|nr:18030_t:CDS:2 [Cetraspora pellucida]
MGKSVKKTRNSRRKSLAAVSIMTKKLMDRLGLHIQKKSSTVVVTATGAKTRALGKINRVKIAIQDAVIPSDFQIIESSDETFIKGFATIARPLHELLKKDVKFEWEKDQNDAFETLKEYLVSAPILQYPNFDKVFYLHTDALGIRLGAVLAQKGEEKTEHVISYASRSLSRAERNYSTPELECLAVLWAIEHYHQYFRFKPFVVVTDHSALKWLHTSKLKGRRARWILRLQPYNYAIEHRSGRVHSNADALSRRPTSNEEELKTPTDFERLVARCECDEDEDGPKAEDVETHPTNLTDESEVTDENKMDWERHVPDSDYDDEEKNPPKRTVQLSMGNRRSLVGSERRRGSNPGG